MWGRALITRSTVITRVLQTSAPSLADSSLCLLVDSIKCKISGSSRSLSFLSSLSGKGGRKNVNSGRFSYLPFSSESNGKKISVISAIPVQKPYMENIRGFQTLSTKDLSPRIYVKEVQCSKPYQDSIRRFQTLSFRDSTSRTCLKDVHCSKPYMDNIRMFQSLSFKNSSSRMAEQRKQTVNVIGTRKFASSSSVLGNTNRLARKHINGVMLSSIRHASRDRGGFSNVHSRISSLQIKKRTQRKKKQIQEDAEAAETVAGFSPVARHKFLTFDPDFSMPEVQVVRPPRREWQVTAYATADEYHLDKLMAGLSQQGLYTPTAIISDGSTEDVLHAVASYKLEPEHREIYFFREGTVVFWNIGELERANVLRFLKTYQEGAYNESVVQEECESLTYKYSDVPVKTKLVRDKITLNPEGQTNLEKYTFSNVLAMSVKLGIWEASLDTYIDNIEYVSEELSKTGHVVLSQGEVLQRLGQLCALRHLINLSSDLLDVPDFYWEHEQLEQLYKKTSDYLSVTKRTSVMNVKLNHCIELMELLKSHLNERHSSRLEWIIIILILVEVVFELLHFLERFL